MTGTKLGKVMEAFQCPSGVEGFFHLGEGAMTRSLQDIVAELQPGEHLCAFYDTTEEQFALLIPFLKAGLEGGEKCFCFVDDGAVDDVHHALEQGGVPLGEYLASGQLVVLPSEKAYLRGGTFDPDWWLECVQDSINQAEREGYKGLRGAGEMTWALGGCPGSERLLEYEARINAFFQGHRLVALCQYHRPRFPAELLLGVLKTHPRVVVGRRFLRNFYYIPPEEYPRRDPARELDRLIRQLQEQERLEEELHERIRQSKQQAAELAALHVIATTASHFLDFNTLLDDALDTALAILGGEGGHIRLLDEASDELVLTVHRGRSEAFVKERARLRWEESALAPLKDGEEALIIPDLREAGPVVALALSEGYRSYAAIPLCSRGRVVGTLTVLSYTPGAFRWEDMPFLSAIGHQLGIGIERASLYQRVQEQLQKEQALVGELKRVQRVATHITSGLDLDTVLGNIISVMAEACGTQMSSILLVDEEAKELVRSVSVGLPQEFVEAVPRVSIGPNSRVCGTAAYRDEMVIVEDVRTDPLTIPYLDLLEPCGIRAVWSIPLRSKHGKVIGVFTTYSRHPYRPTQEQVELGELYARHASVVIENARSYQKAQQQAANLSRLYQASVQVITSLDLDEVLAFIARNAVEAIGAASCSIILFQDGHVLKRALWDRTGLLKRVPSVRPSGISRKVVETGNVWMIPDVAKELPGLVNPDLMLAGRRAAICLPLPFKEHITGVMWVCYNAPHAFTEEEVILLSSFAQQATIAIERARLHEVLKQHTKELKQSRQRLEELCRLSLSMQEQLSMDEQLKLILKGAHEVLEFDRINVFLPDAEGRMLECRAVVGNTQEPMEHIRVPLGEAGGAVARAFLEGREVIYQGEMPAAWRLHEPYASIKDLRSRAFVALPLIARGTPIAVLAADNKFSRRPISQEAVRLLRVFAAQAAIAIENTRLFTTVREKARQLEALFATTRLLASSYGIKEILGLLAVTTTRITGAVDCAVFLVDEDEDRLTLQASSGEEASMRGKQLLDEGVISCLYRQVVEENQPLLVGDLVQERELLRRYFFQGNPLKLLLMAPIRIRDKVLGAVVTFFDSSLLSSPKETLDLVSTAAYLAAIAIEDTRLMSRSALLQEIHHRVKNNLQTVASLLYLQLSRHKPTVGKAAFQQSISRIKSIAAVHDLLSADNRGLVRIKELLHKIVGMVVGQDRSDRKTEVVIEGFDCFLPSKEATALALIVHELVTNSVSHGFRGKKRRKITLRILPDAETLSVQVEDNGKGLPPGFSLEWDASLGLRIVESIAKRDLNGTFAITSERGTTATVMFPWSEEVRAGSQERNGSGLTRAQGLDRRG